MTSNSVPASFPIFVHDDQKTQQQITRLVEKHRAYVDERPQADIGLEMILRDAALEAEGRGEDIIKSVRSACANALRHDEPWDVVVISNEMNEGLPPEVLHRYGSLRTTQEKVRFELRLILSRSGNWMEAIRKVIAENPDALEDPDYHQQQAAEIRQIHKIDLSGTEGWDEFIHDLYKNINGSES